MMVQFFEVKLLPTEYCGPLMNFSIAGCERRIEVASPRTADHSTRSLETKLSEMEAPEISKVVRIEIYAKIIFSNLREDVSTSSFASKYSSDYTIHSSVFWVLQLETRSSTGSI